MTTITIRNLSDWKKALAIPGAIIWVERHDALGHNFSRDASLREKYERPRTVAKLQQKEVAYLVDGAKIWFTFPKAADLIADGTNRVSVRCNNQWAASQGDTQAEGLITYRIEHPESATAHTPPPSLATLYPPVADEVLAEEQRQRQANADAEAVAVANYRAEYTKRQARPVPPPQAPALAIRAIILKAIQTALQEGDPYSEALLERVLTEIKDRDTTLDRRFPDYTHPRDAERNARNLTKMDLRYALAAEPRGTWQIHIEHSSDGTPHYQAFMSTGVGDTHPYGCHDLDAMTFENIYRELVGQEIYRIRFTDIPTAEAKKQTQEALENQIFFKGQKLSDIVLNNTTHSSATISAVDASTGQVHLQLTRRGSRTRWNAKVNVGDLAHYVSRSTKPKPHTAPPSPPKDDLFAV